MKLILLLAWNRLLDGLDWKRQFINKFIFMASVWPKKSKHWTWLVMNKSLQVFIFFIYSFVCSLRHKRRITKDVCLFVHAFVYSVISIYCNFFLFCSGAITKNFMITKKLMADFILESFFSPSQVKKYIGEKTRMYLTADSIGMYCWYVVPS